MAIAGRPSAAGQPGARHVAHAYLTRRARFIDPGASAAVRFVAHREREEWKLLVLLEPKFKHNTFVYNLKTRLSSVVTWDQKGDPSLGSVAIVKKGSNPIP